jgi:hypothetical protein
MFVYEMSGYIQAAIYMRVEEDRGEFTNVMQLFRQRFDGCVKVLLIK